MYKSILFKPCTRQQSELSIIKFYKTETFWVQITNLTMQNFVTEIMSICIKLSSNSKTSNFNFTINKSKSGHTLNENFEIWKLTGSIFHHPRPAG